jgi:hypothetical protein
MLLQIRFWALEGKKQSKARIIAGSVSHKSLLATADLMASVVTLDLIDDISK